MSKFSFITDPDTVRLLDITAHFLNAYFGHNEDSAIAAINGYHDLLKQQESEHPGVPMQSAEDHFHHEGAYYLASLIHYRMGLRGDPGDYLSWRLKHADRFARDASEYFREHYLDLESPPSNT